MKIGNITPLPDTCNPRHFNENLWKCVKIRHKKNKWKLKLLWVCFLSLVLLLCTCLHVLFSRRLQVELLRWCKTLLCLYFIGIWLNFSSAKLRIIFHITIIFDYTLNLIIVHTHLQYDFWKPGKLLSNTLVIIKKYKNYISMIHSTNFICIFAPKIA